MSKKSFIDSVKVNNPCSESWEKMHGNDRVRFCSHCSKTVSNLSSITRKEAMSLVSKSGGDLCIRYISNPQTKKPLFADQLIQLTRRRPGLMAGVMSASLSLSTLAYAQVEPSAPTPPESEPTVNLETDYSNQTDETPAEESPTPTDPEKGSIEGFIWDANGKGVKGVELLLINAESTSDTDYETTDDTGFYRFKDLAPGSYVIRIDSVHGMRKAGPPVTVGEGAKLVQNLHITLEERGRGEGKGSGTGEGWGGAMAAVEYSLPLSKAVSSNDVDAVKQLLESGSKVNSKDENYDDITPLFLAVENGNIAIIQLLLEHGANVNARDKLKRVPLMFLDSDATPELVQMLLNAGAKIRTVAKDGSSILLEAVESAEPIVIETLIRGGADVNEANEEGETPLIKAAENDKLEIVEILVKAGADVNAKDKSGQTAWERTSNVEVEEFLVQYGAIVDYGNLVVIDRSKEGDDE